MDLFVSFSDSQGPRKHSWGGSDCGESQSPHAACKSLRDNLMLTLFSVVSHTQDELPQPIIEVFLRFPGDSLLEGVRAIDSVIVKLRSFCCFVQMCANTTRILVFICL